MNLCPICNEPCQGDLCREHEVEAQVGLGELERAERRSRDAIDFDYFDEEVNMYITFKDGSVGMLYRFAYLDPNNNPRQTALIAKNENGDSLGVLTVNIGGNAEIVGIKDYSEGEKFGYVKALQDIGVIGDRPIRYVQTGFVRIPVFRIKNLNDIPEGPY